MEALAMDEDAFVHLVLSDAPPRPSNSLDVIEKNLGQQAIDDDRAFEFEPGPIPARRARTPAPATDPITASHSRDAASNHPIHLT